MLLNTRPILQASNLNSLLIEQNLTFINYPTLCIEQIPLIKKVWRTSYIFFISSSAVIHFIEQLDDVQDFFKETTVYAVGEATKKQLLLYNITAISPVDVFDSNSILKLLPNSLHNAGCLVVKGEGGLNNLTLGLIAKQAIVNEVECYKRVENAFCAKPWNSFKQANNGIVLIASLDSFSALINNMPAKERVILLQKTAIIFSKRIEVAMLNLGWKGQTHIVEKPTNLAIIKALKTVSF